MKYNVRERICKSVPNISQANKATLQILFVSKTKNMFKLFKKKKGQNIPELLSNQVIGGQSVLFKIFKEIIEEKEKDIKKTELTYFALSALGYFYLRLAKTDKKENMLDQASLIVLQKSIPYSKENISTKEAIREYQKRYEEYDKLIQLVFEKETIDSHACTTLLMHIYECATQKSAKGKMIKITASSSLIAQYLVDHVEFIKQNL